VTPAAKREAVAQLRFAFDMSERRACRTIGCVRGRRQFLYLAAGAALLPVVSGIARPHRNFLLQRGSREVALNCRANELPSCPLMAIWSPRRVDSGAAVVDPKRHFDDIELIRHSRC
jgi:hypothetical protein